MSLLRRARELIQQYKFGTDEVEESIAIDQALPSEALDLALLAVDDALKLADELWSGNTRAGRSLRDLKDLLAGASIEVPADEQTLKLILCDDATFEAALLKLLSRRNEQREEQVVATVVTKLRRPRSAEKSLAECHQHAVWMSRILNDAIALVRKAWKLKSGFVRESGFRRGESNRPLRTHATPTRVPLPPSGLSTRRCAIISTTAML